MDPELQDWLDRYIARATDAAVPSPAPDTRDDWMAQQHPAFASREALQSLADEQVAQDVTPAATPQPSTASAVAPSFAADVTDWMRQHPSSAAATAIAAPAPHPEPHPEPDIVPHDDGDEMPPPPPKYGDYTSVALPRELEARTIAAPQVTPGSMFAGMLPGTPTEMAHRARLEALPDYSTQAIDPEQRARTMAAHPLLSWEDLFGGKRPATDDEIARMEADRTARGAYAGAHRPPPVAAGMSLWDAYLAGKRGESLGPQPDPSGGLYHAWVAGAQEKPKPVPRVVKAQQLKDGRVLLVYDNGTFGYAGQGAPTTPTPAGKPTRIGAAGGGIGEAPELPEGVTLNPTQQARWNNILRMPSKERGAKADAFLAELQQENIKGATQQAVAQKRSSTVSAFEQANPHLQLSSPDRYVEARTQGRAVAQMDKQISNANRAIDASNRLIELDREYAAIPMTERLSTRALEIQGEYDKLRHEHQGIILQIAGSGSGAEPDRRYVREGIPGLAATPEHFSAPALQGIHRMLLLNARANLMGYGIEPKEGSESAAPAQPTVKKSYRITSPSGRSVEQPLSEAAAVQLREHGMTVEAM